MSDDIWRAVGELSGELNGVKTKQAEQREDINALGERIETLRRDMAAGFIAQRHDTEALLGSAREDVKGLISSAVLNAAELALSRARDTGLYTPIPAADPLANVKAALAKPAIAYPLSTGIGVVLLMILQKYGVIT